MKKKQSRKEIDSKEDKKKKPKESEIKKSEGKESDLEKKVEEKNEEEEIEEEFNEFKEFVPQVAPQIATRSPVLERINRVTQTQQEVEIPNQTAKTENKRIDYSTVSNLTNEPKYNFSVNDEQEERKYETNFVPPVLSRKDSQSMRQEFLMPSDRSWKSENSNIDSQSVEWDIFEDIKKLPFETEQKKYKPFRLK
ncbi:MAG: hypothetical protein NTU63_03970 [Candidatus Pacearchaeota archaeon]|nr:hypothetical protein [Candidatus Pacearchaeota archaeon]